MKPLHAPSLGDDGTVLVARVRRRDVTAASSEVRGQVPSTTALGLPSVAQTGSSARVA